jgi:hypothetical protein
MKRLGSSFPAFTSNANDDNYDARGPDRVRPSAALTAPLTVPFRLFGSIISAVHLTTPRARAWSVFFMSLSSKCGEIN